MIRAPGCYCLMRSNLDDLQRVLGEDPGQSFGPDEIISVCPTCPIHGERPSTEPDRTSEKMAVFVGGHRDGETMRDPGHYRYRLPLPFRLEVRPPSELDLIAACEPRPVETYEREGLDDWGRRIYRITPI